MEKITLVCTSLNPDKNLLNKMLASSGIYFDETVLHIDQMEIPQIYEFGHPHKQISRFCNAKHLEVGEAYNLMINGVQTEWVCCFCDDDYFYENGLREMITEVHVGIEADVAHFKFRVSGHIPPEDVRCLFGKKEYDLCEKKPITPKLLSKHNRLPAGSFFRKSALEKVGGFQGNKCHDWDLWKRMAQAGCKFKYFDHLVYNYVRRDNSAWVKQHLT